LASTTIRIAMELENIAGIKEASGNLDQFGKIVKAVDADFIVTSGDDNLALPACAIGGAGVISVVANAFPLQFSNMIRAAHANEYEKARNIHHSLTELIDLLFVEGNPGGIKAALKIMGICGDTMRAPLANISTQTYAAIAESIALIES